jgi:hypothetical protein
MPLILYLYERVRLCFVDAFVMSLCACVTTGLYFDVLVARSVIPYGGRGEVTTLHVST